MLLDNFGKSGVKSMNANKKLKQSHQILRNKNNQLYIQENMMVKKGEHYTVPIKASYKNKVSGTIIEQSNKGQTVFIEPVAISKLNEQLTLLKAEETAEEYQILAELTGLINEQERLVDQAVDTMTTLDIIFARGKYSREIGGITPKVNKEERLRIVQGKHPLLLEHAVPLTFSLEQSIEDLSLQVPMLVVKRLS